MSRRTQFTTIHAFCYFTVVVLLALTGCGETQSDDSRPIADFIVGTWQTIKGGKVTASFRSDGTFTWKSKSGDSMSGTYLVKGSEEIILHVTREATNLAGKETDEQRILSVSRLDEQVRIRFANSPYALTYSRIIDVE